VNAFLRVDSWADIHGAIAKMQAAGVGHRIPLLQGLLHGRIARMEFQRDGSARQFKQWAAASRLPALALLGDDDHAVPDGPDSWPCARRVLRWARFVLIHGGSGRPEHYEYAAHLTGIHGRLVMVECSSANISAWQAAAERWAVGAQGLTMRPPLGCPHPSLDRGGLH